MRVYVDHTHLWRPTTGLERVTAQLFSPQALAPLDVVPVTAGGTASMVLTQTFGLAARLMLAPSSVMLCPGFPPSPLLGLFGPRVIPYIHDVFLLSRRHDLNWRAALYSASPFGMAVRRLPRFMVNSVDTGMKLASYCRPGADIAVYRPGALNTFALSPSGRAARRTDPTVFRLVVIATVEPRKNLLAAARIVTALREAGIAGATLDVIGRRGWGDDWQKLKATPGVTLHGYMPDARMSRMLDDADALICTSHEEGLGLPLLEAQYGGLPVIAPDQPVFHEVLGGSGIFIDTADPKATAQKMTSLIASDNWRAGFVGLAAKNLARWNAAAEADRDRVIGLIQRAARDAAGVGAGSRFDVAR